MALHFDSISFAFFFLFLTSLTIRQTFFSSSNSLQYPYLSSQISSNAVAEEKKIPLMGSYVKLIAIDCLCVNISGNSFSRFRSLSFSLFYVIQHIRFIHCAPNYNRISNYMPAIFAVMHYCILIYYIPVQLVSVCVCVTYFLCSRFCKRVSTM